MSDLPERVRRWQQTRELGRQRYIVRYGVGLWGVSVAILWSIAFSSLAEPQMPILIVLPLALVIFPMVGYAWGAVMWMLAERWYLMELKKHRKSDQRGGRLETAVQALAADRGSYQI